MVECLRKEWHVVCYLRIASDVEQESRGAKAHDLQIFTTIALRIQDLSISTLQNTLYGMYKFSSRRRYLKVA